MTYNPAPMRPNIHLDPDHRYACHNRAPIDRVKYNMQDGWTDDGRKAMVKHETEWLHHGCGHSYRKSDPCCTGCKWRHKP